MKNIKFILIALAAFGMIACSAEGPTERADQEEMVTEEPMEGTRLKTDANFIKIFIQQTMFSMTAAEIANDRAVNPKVRDFAGKLVEDHRRLYEEAVALANNNKLPVPDETSPELAEELDELRSADQLGFDEMYLEKVINFHQIVAAEAEALIKNSKLEPIIDFATKMNEAQFVHFNRAQELRQELDT